MEHTPTTTRVIAGARIAFALLALVAIVAQYTWSDRDPFLGSGDFFFLFTYQSNVMAALVLLAGAWRLWSNQVDSPGWDLIRGAVVTWMATTGIVYATLPTSSNDTGIRYSYEWASDVLHQLMPIVLLLDWLISPPQHRLAFRRALVWTLYPLAFCAISLLRGPVADWYPYPFLDPREDGWAMVGVYVVAISAGFVVFSWVVVTIGNAARQWWAARISAKPVPERLA